MGEHEIYADYSRGGERSAQCACGWYSGWRASYSECRRMHLAHINQQSDNPKARDHMTAFTENTP